MGPGLPIVLGWARRVSPQPKKAVVEQGGKQIWRDGAFGAMTRYSTNKTRAFAIPSSSLGISHQSEVERGFGQHGRNVSQGVRCPGPAREPVDCVNMVRTPTLDTDVDQPDNHNTCYSVYVQYIVIPIRTT
ncbi:predicted protein [Histoplasma capsulatum G186AR]|uniref:Uncharacterized protein n=1 Tax=Ajellomyces capsulatus (strain G186AR / H82 / ATCC MYA-2454 / RMSCC 2432) TaxID=447093 RepID=C0NWY2_AJECG|nr:uncharacterized protein HCBG_07974 [Histoplasma capsulatum G186AR]EEH03848.1 predicted protein [Histoplasma capsulatum G186AR]